MHMSWKCSLVLLLSTILAASVLSARVLHAEKVPVVSSSSSSSYRAYRSWSVDDVQKWLSSVGLDSTADKFKQEQIEGSLLDDLSIDEQLNLMPLEATRLTFQEELALLKQGKQATNKQEGDDGAASAATSSSNDSSSGSPSEAKEAKPNILHRQIPRLPSACSNGEVRPGGCSCFTKEAKLQNLTVDLLQTISMRHPLRTEAPEKETFLHPMDLGVGRDGCTRQISRLMSSEFQSSGRRKLIVQIGEEYGASGYFRHEWPAFDFIIFDTPDKSEKMHPLLVKDSLSIFDRNDKDNNKVFAANIPVPFLHQVPCILREFHIQPDIIYVQEGKENLQKLMNIYNKASSTSKQRRPRCSCDRWWEPREDMWLFPPQIMGVIPDVPQHEGYLNQLAVEAFRKRIYVDQPCFSITDSSLGSNCLDYEPDAISPVPAPLLTLNMIVKDEAAGIKQTLDSVLPFVDRALIMDTGSSDKTVTFIKEKFDDFDEVQGTIFKGPFVDFSTTRNTALAKAVALYPDPIFVLTLNGDDVVTGGGPMRKFLESRRHLCGPSEEIYILNVDFEGKKKGWSERILRTNNARRPNWPDVNSHDQWYYKGMTHEVYLNRNYAKNQVAMSYVGTQYSSTSPLIGGPGTFGIRHTYRESTAHQAWRYKKDAELLEAELVAEPDNERTLYYLARSYDLLGRFQDSLPLFERRAESIRQRLQEDFKYPSELHLTNDDEFFPPPAFEAVPDECYSMLRRAKLLVRLVNPKERDPEEHTTIVQAFKEGMRVCETAAEFPFYLAEYYGGLPEPKFDLMAFFLAHAERIAVHNPGVFETAVTKELIPALIKAFVKEQPILWKNYQAQIQQNPFPVKDEL